MTAWPTPDNIGETCLIPQKTKGDLCPTMEQHKINSKYSYLVVVSSHAELFTIVNRDGLYHS